MTVPPDFLADREALPIRVRALAESSPDRTAITCIDDGHSLTWSGVHTEALKWCDAFQRVGVQRGDAVATMLPQSLVANTVWLGTAWAGAIEFAINNAFKGPWLTHALNTATAKIMVVEESFLPAVQAVLSDLPRLETVVVCRTGRADRVEFARTRGRVNFVSIDEFLAGCVAQEQDWQPDLCDTACAIFTSGTTGPSKAVLMPWGQIAAFAQLAPYEVPDRQVFFIPFSPFHLAGKGALQRPALTGTRSVIREKLSVSQFWDDIRGNGATWAWIVPLLAHVLHKSPPHVDDLDNPLEYAFVGPSFPFIDELRERYGFKAYSTWGMTETANPFYLPPERTTSANFRSSGKPVPGVDAVIVDEKDNEVAAGEAGELVLRSQRPWVFSQGYFGKPEASLDAWRNGWFHTGDKFRRNESGEFEYIDRLKDAIRRRGENVSSMELENAIMESPDVAECAAIAIPSDVGEDDVMAVLVTQPGIELTPREFIESLHHRVPDFAIPRYVRFVDALPRTQVTDRVQKFKLREEGVTSDTWDRDSDTAFAPTSGNRI